MSVETAADFQPNKPVEVLLTFFWTGSHSPPSPLVVLLDLLFPRRCLGCGRSGRYFCSNCREKIAIFQKNFCPVCERPSINGATHSRCRTAWGIDGIKIVFSYEGLIKKAVIKLKYRFISDLAEELARLAAGNLSPLPNSKDFLFIPVPLHKRRSAWRGFNQSEILGRILARKYGGIFAPAVLQRKVATKPQANLTEKSRRQNVAGAFSLAGKYRAVIKGRKVVVFDDVWTTGSTLRECALVLKRAGAASVCGLALAS